VVQIRVTPKTRNPFAIRASSISGVTRKWHFLNHAGVGVQAARHGGVDDLVGAVGGSIAHLTDDDRRRGRAVLQHQRAGHVTLLPQH
jgi:hypothetical protein